MRAQLHLIEQGAIFICSYLEQKNGINASRGDFKRDSLQLAIDAAYTLDHYHEKALPGLMTSATDVAQSVRKLRQLTERYHAVFIPGHDPEEWKKNRLAPACYY